MKNFSKFLVFNDNVDDEELHHSGRVERDVVWCTVVLALLLALVWWVLFVYYTPKTATVISVVLGVAVILRFCVYFPRRDRHEAGVVTEQQ
jgi:Flp pilus assembly protein TadB